MLLYSEGGVGGKGTHACLPFWLKPRVDFHQKWLERLHQHFCPTRPSRGVFWGGSSRVNRPGTPMGVLGRFGFPRPFPPRRRAYTFRRRRGVSIWPDWSVLKSPSLPPSPAPRWTQPSRPFGAWAGGSATAGSHPPRPARWSWVSLFGVGPVAALFPRGGRSCPSVVGLSLPLRGVAYTIAGEPLAAGDGCRLRPLNGGMRGSLPYLVSP